MNVNHVCLRTRSEHGELNNEPENFKSHTESILFGWRENSAVESVLSIPEAHALIPGTTYAYTQRHEKIKKKNKKTMSLPRTYTSDP